MDAFKKLIAEKCGGGGSNGSSWSLRRGMSRKALLTAGESNSNSARTAICESSRPIEDPETFSFPDPDDIGLETASESDMYEEAPPTSAGDTNKSLYTTNSYSAYKRSVSPDTMLQGTSSISSISFRRSHPTLSLMSDYSSDLSFFGLNSSIIATHKPSNALVEYWWDLTPQNMHCIVSNYLYDRQNKRCHQYWTFLEKKLAVTRVTIFYVLAAAYFMYILTGDLARLLYYAMGVGYPMYRTFTTYKDRGLDACTSWLRYWVVFGWLSLFDVLIYRYMKQWTVYWSVKIIFTIYLLMPLVKGADLIYRDFIRNFNKTIESNVQFITGK